MASPVGSPSVLILGANSDVGKEALRLYVSRGYHVLAASRSTEAVKDFVKGNISNADQVEVLYFDAVNFESHQKFYDGLTSKPHIVLYAAGFQVHNDQALVNWEGTFQMMKVHYCGAVSILNIIATDKSNTNLKRIIGLSSLSGVRGRKSNFIYGSTKAAFTQYLQGLRQHLADRNIIVNVVVAGYIRSKMTADLTLPETLVMEPSFIAAAVVNAGDQLKIVPGFKWKIIYLILCLLPESLVAKLP
jgi:decaprenylphospho-beta-D-erythro-pentofuranosid-2-ulose 2-reductase